MGIGCCEEKKLDKVMTCELSDDDLIVVTIAD